MTEFEPNELKRRVDEVLFYQWDPIGVAPDPNARREYSSYVEKVLAMLQKDEAVTKIEKYLCEIESGLMALPAKQERARYVAELMIAHKEAIEDGRA